MATRRRSQPLVIDASVARAAGGIEAVFPTSKNCRDFLAAALRICHTCVFSPKTLQEWKRHQSNFSRTWQVSMYARKKIILLSKVEDAPLRVAIDASGFTQNQKDAMTKDCHLVEAALLSGYRVIALDETVRKLFSDMSKSGGGADRLRSIAWVNPDRPAEEVPLEWLEAGAPIEGARQLGAA